MDVDSAIAKSFEKLGFVSEEQRVAIKAFVNGRDVFVCLPTGFGKSLCYASLPVVFDILNGHHEQDTGTFACVIMVSPLRALMKNQVESFRRKGMTAVDSVTTNTDDKSNSRVKEKVTLSEYQLVFTSSELLLYDANWTDVFKSKTLIEHLVAIVIDEAHCVKKW